MTCFESAAQDVFGVRCAIAVTITIVVLLQICQREYKCGPDSAQKTVLEWPWSGGVVGLLQCRLWYLKGVGGDA